ncbi:holin family protein [Novosphingobium piscinae]|uniref:Holin family protein n=1 Tax=Novosphingobium piscinae TaxID=1507448 RepID=A0A7X1KPC5_9SPHN|nr:holin family protein [Novosphingobium piscinae]MBC2668621.1 holin family protein [Novosphingobium piscinae]
MAIFDALLAPISTLIDKIVPDPKARDAAKLELLRLQGSQELELLRTQLSAIVAEAGAADPWTSRARPSFLYVMYALILLAVPMGVVAAFRPDMAEAIGRGMTAYLNGLPEPLYALFGTGYLGYTAARQWGKARGTDR